MSSEQLICGIDEVGRGPLAGPVVAAAVILPESYSNSEIRDSKQLSARKRERLVGVIKRDALAWSIVAVGHQRIAQLNIRSATRLAMELALVRAARKHKPDLVLIDGNMPISSPFPQQTVVEGDSLHVQISAASIIAKEYRDGLMRTLDEKYPGYNLASHSGYPTTQHRDAIRSIGPSPVHRRTFHGVLEYWQSAQATFSFPST